MKIKTYFGLFCSTFLFGILLFAYFEGWITIKLPRYILSPAQADHTENTSKITLAYWTSAEWKTEQTHILRSSEIEETIEHIVNALLCTLYESHLLKKPVKINTVMISTGQNELFISFDRNPFLKEASIFAKWMLIESILKTLKANDIKIPLVRFLVNQEPLEDQHLDMASSWPITGFLL